jgi:hypothetical protein
MNLPAILDFQASAFADAPSSPPRADLKEVSQCRFLSTSAKAVASVSKPSCSDPKGRSAHNVPEAILNSSCQSLPRTRIPVRPAAVPCHAERPPEAAARWVAAVAEASTSGPCVPPMQNADPCGSAFDLLGWVVGLEPTTAGATDRSSTTELYPPCPCSSIAKLGHPEASPLHKT